MGLTEDLKVIVIPAQTGVQLLFAAVRHRQNGIPAFAGMTNDQVIG
jgi:hypothetical protein